MTFPNDWPADCPPTDAVDANGVVFRLVQSRPQTAVDFQTHFELGKMPTAPPCLRCGLSVFRTPEDAHHQFRAFPKLGRYLASGTLQSEHGKTKLTHGRQPTHTTWWVSEGVDRPRVFQVVEDLV
ncbi:MAG: hypothetical protein IAG10_08940 [Planctomycetaceae bacterium]|nr:hypothetical protein [Planctomycetaceae bacterium]